MALGPLQLLLLALGVYRAARLVVVDTVSADLRDRVTTWASNGGGWRRALSGTLGCSHCTGWWLSLGGYVVAVIAAGRVHEVPWLLHAVECWGVMGAQALFSSFDAYLTRE